jgi:hypothetical protein
MKRSDGTLAVVFDISGRRRLGSQMTADRRASEEGLHIKYVGRDAYWINGFVLFVGSAIALVTAYWFIAAGVSADAISQTMVWLSCPWFLALYFLSYRLRKLAESGFESCSTSASSPHTQLHYLL